MTENYFRDAIGRFAKHRLNAADVTLRRQTTADDYLHAAFSDFQIYGGSEAREFLSEAAATKFKELASEVFGNVTDISYWGPNEDGVFEPAWFNTRRFQRYNFDKNDPEYAHDHVELMTQLEDLARLVNTSDTAATLRVADGQTIVDRSNPAFPREIDEHHLEADAGHTPVDSGGDYCETCGLAITSDAKRHGFDA